MDYLLEHLESALHLHTASDATSHILISINLAWGKLNKYYSLTETNLVLYAAVALHPSMKFDYFETTWQEHPAWIENAKAKVQELWESM